MRNDHYPQGTVQALMLTDKVSPASYKALQNRLDRVPIIKPKFFDADIFITLQAVCARLLPQSEPERHIDLAGCFDGILAEGKGNGWRYDAMPADGKAFTIGLHGINKTSASIFGRYFHLLTANEQEEVLTSIQSGHATGFTWDILPANLFFEELLAAVVELYYSHPFAKEDIGDASMADAKGWKKIGLNELETHEPEILKER